MVQFFNIFNLECVRKRGYEKTDMLLQQYPNLRGIFSVTGCTGDIGQAIIDRKAKNIKVRPY